MNDVRLDPQQVPARAELLLAAELGEDAPGRPIYAKPEPDGQGCGEPTARIKVGAVLTRRLHAAEAAETPAGAAYGNPLRGRPERAPSGPVGSALLARTDAADAHGWRVYRVTPTGTVMYDEWIDHDPANGGLAVTQLRAAAGRSPEAALRRAVAGRVGHTATRDVAEWLANEPTGRLGSRGPARGRHGAGGAGTSRAGGAAHDRAQDERTASGWPGGARRLELHGAGALADDELLAILVGANSVQAARTLLDACGTVQQLAHESTGDLARITACSAPGSCRPGRWTRASSIPEEVFRTAATRRAAAIVLCHDHPFGGSHSEH